MDRRVVERKLESLRRCVVRIQTRCPASPDLLLTDVDAQDVLTLNLSRAVQLCVDMVAYLLPVDAPVPQTMGESFVRLAEAGVISHELATRMRRAVGFRNLVVHDYSSIDWTIVFAVARERTEDFEAFARIVAKGLSD